MKLRDYFFGEYLDKDEKIFYVAHRHIIFLKVDTSKVGLFGFIIPILLYLFFPQLLLLAIIWMAVAALVYVYYFITWYYDAWIITNQGVIDVQQVGFWGYTTTRVEYHMIEGLSYTVAGFWPMIFNYGTITIDKLGAQTKLVLENASNPKKVERMVLKYQEQYVSKRAVRDHAALKGLLSEMISYHVNSGKIDEPGEK